MNEESKRIDNYFNSRDVKRRNFSSRSKKSIKKNYIEWKPDNNNWKNALRGNTAEKLKSPKRDMLTMTTESKNKIKNSINHLMITNTSPDQFKASGGGYGVGKSASFKMKDTKDMNLNKEIYEDRYEYNNTVHTLMNEENRGREMSSQIENKDPNKMKKSKLSKEKQLREKFEQDLRSRLFNHRNKK